MRERVGLRSWQKQKLFKEALLYGKSPANINDPALQRYLKKPHAKTKLYKGYVFIYSKNGKNLYTMYEVPNYIKEMIK